MVTFAHYLTLNDMKRTILFCTVLIMTLSAIAQPQMRKDAPKVNGDGCDKTPGSQWQGKRVAFLGDSMTDKKRVGTTCVYWEYLTGLLGIEPLVYGISGNQWDGVYQQALRLKSEHGGNVDAIIIFAGTNDYNHNIPVGVFFTETTRQTNYNGNEVIRKFRTPVLNDTTFCGRINKVMTYLKDNFPQQQIVIMTPIHRGFARFGDKNVQPGENYANGLGLYVDTYVDMLRQAASNWAVPLIDLYSISGLYPLSDSQTIYFHDAQTDRLHPNALGDYRLARTIQYQMLSLPSSYRIGDN
jgi:lysophospholipase L1-like esterase